MVWRQGRGAYVRRGPIWSAASAWIAPLLFAALLLVVTTGHDRHRSPESAVPWLVVLLASGGGRKGSNGPADRADSGRESDRRYRALVDHALAGVYVIQGDRFVFVNRRFAEMFGYSETEVVNEVRVADLVAPEDRDKVAEQLRRRFSGEIEAVRYEFVALAKGGRRFRVEAFGSIMDMPSGRAVQGMVVDKEDEEAARRVLDAAYEAAVGLRGRDPFMTAATSIAALLEAPIVLISLLQDGDLKVLAAVGAIRDPGRIPLKGTPCERVARDRRPLLVASGLGAQFPCGGDWTDAALESYAGVPIMQSSGELLGVIAALDTVPRGWTEVQTKVLEIYAVRVGSEIERRSYETREKEIERRLAQSQKLEALGVLAGGIAHDFNNVLAGVSGTAELLVRTLPPGAERERAAEIAALAQRGGDVVRRILSFARREIPAARAVDLNQVVREAIALARHSIGPHIELVRDTEAGETWIDGDSGQLQQMLLNLIINARDAMPTGGKVSVRTHALDGSGAVLLEVRDEGVGIPPEVLPHVFEPFFTTKPPGEGTGLGLAQVYRIVSAHRATARIHSDVGRGTTVVIGFPAGRLRPEAPVVEAAAEAATPHTLLLVDDEPIIVRSLTEVLSLEGYRVLAANSAAEALRLWDDAAATVDVALLDIAMPGTSGVALGAQLRSTRPGLPVIFSSGYAPESLAPGVLDQPGVSFLQKPYTANGLLAAVKHALKGTKEFVSGT